MYARLVVFVYGDGSRLLRTVVYICGSRTVNQKIISFS